MVRPGNDKATTLLLCATAFFLLKADSCTGTGDGGGASVTCVADGEVYARMELAPGYASPIPRYCWLTGERWMRVSDFEDVEVREVPSWILVEPRGPETYLQVVAVPDAPQGAEGLIVIGLTRRSPGSDSPSRSLLRIQVRISEQWHLELERLDTPDPALPFVSVGARAEICPRFVDGRPLDPSSLQIAWSTERDPSCTTPADVTITTRSDARCDLPIAVVEGKLAGCARLVASETGIVGRPARVASQDLRVVAGPIAIIEPGDFHYASTGVVRGDASRPGPGASRIVRWDWSASFRLSGRSDWEPVNVAADGFKAEIPSVNAGTYAVELTVTDDMGQTHQSRREIDYVP